MTLSTSGGGDLQSVLAVLAQFSKPPESSPPPNVQTSRFENDRPKTDPIASWSSSQGPVPPSNPMIDPATITVWPEALRCVTALANQNARFSASIKKMIDSQRANEIRWYKDRQALKQQQANRASASAKAQSILASLQSTPLVNPESINTPGVDSKAELEEFDRKLYRAQGQMESDMCAQLKVLGVPFFGTPSYLLRHQDERSSISTEHEMASDRPKWSVVVTDQELRKLQRRMLEHLEDLYNT